MSSTLSSAIGWADLKVAFGLFLGRDSQVVLKEDLLISVAHNKGGLSGITVERDMVGGEAMPKAILRWALRFPFHAGLSTLAIFVGDVVGFDEQSSAFESFTAAVHELPVR